MIKDEWSCCEITQDVQANKILQEALFHTLRLVSPVFLAWTVRKED